MDVHTFLFGFLVLETILHLSSGRGKMVEPPQRSSLWRHEEWYGKPMVATNTDDGGLNCGGYWKLHEVNHHRCGICGDAFDNKGRPNEAGGRFAQGYIARTYYHDKSKLINVTVDIKANIGGYFEFRLCPNNNIHRRITQECLDKFHLVINGHGYRFYVERDTVIDLQLKIPEDLTCTQCVLQWKWKGSHYWGMCDDGYGGIGCGDQEEYYNCADIAILSSNATNKITGNVTVLPEALDTGISAWTNDVTDSPVPDVTTQDSWGSENGLSTPSWLQDLFLVASQMGKPGRERKHKTHKHSSSESVVVSGAIPVLNLPDVAATSIAVHNITTLHGNNSYPNVTYEIGNITDHQTNSTDVTLGKSPNVKNTSVVDTENVDIGQTNASNNTNIQGRGEHNPSNQWADKDNGRTVIQNPDTLAKSEVTQSPIVKGIPISDNLLSELDTNTLTGNELPWESPAVVNDNTLTWNRGDLGVPGDKDTKTYWAVSNAAESNNPQQNQVDLKQFTNEGNTVSRSQIPDQNIADMGNQVRVTSLPAKTGKATTGTLFNLYSSTIGVVRSTHPPIETITTEIPIPQQPSDAAFRKRIGAPGIPIFAKDYLDIMGQGTLSPSSTLSPADMHINSHSDGSSPTINGPAVSVDNQPTVATTGAMITTDVTTTDVISTQRTNLKSVIDEFAINTENMPHVLKDITTPGTMIPSAQPTYLSTTSSSVWDARQESATSMQANETENSRPESSNISFSDQMFSRNDSETHTISSYTEPENSTTTPPLYNTNTEQTAELPNHTETPQSGHGAEVQLQSPTDLPSADMGIETTSNGIMSDTGMSTINPVTTNSFDSTATTASYYESNAMETGRNTDSLFLRNDNNLNSLMQNVTDVLKNSSGTDNLEWILTGHMVDTNANTEGIPIPTFDPAEIAVEGGTSVKSDSHTNNGNVHASIMQTFESSNKAEIFIKSNNFSAQNKSAYRANTFTGPSNYKNFPTTTESIITPRNILIDEVHSTLASYTGNASPGNTGFHVQQESQTSGAFDMAPVAVVQEKPSPTNDIIIKPDMVLPRGSISFKKGGDKHGNQRTNTGPDFRNNKQVSFGSQDIIDAGRTVGIPLSQIRPGNGGILSDGREVISGLDFVDTDLQYATGNRTIAMSLVDNTVGSPSRPGSMTSSGNAQMMSGQPSMSEQSPVSMRQISQNTSKDKVGGTSYLMHPPPPNAQLSMRPEKLIEDIMRNVRPVQRSRINRG